MRKLALVMSVVLAGLARQPAVAADIHLFWDQRCAECHGHAAAFARQHLVADDDKLLGTHHQQDLKRFMGQHEMGPARVDDMVAMLLAQLKTTPLFQQKCAACHQTAAAFARESLELLDGALVGSKNGRLLSEFLVQHGRLDADEVGPMVDVLTRVYREVH